MQKVSDAGLSASVYCAGYISYIATKAKWKLQYETFNENNDFKIYVLFIINI